MLTWQESYQKAQVISGDKTATTLAQLKQDINVGYHRFNSALGRYFLRKQQFTDLVAGQAIYQTPIDCIKVMGMTVMVTENFQPTVKEIRDEYQWRQIVSWQTTQNWPAYYYMIGNDTLSLWPAPSQDVVNGLRFYYQQRDHDLSIDDVTNVTTSATVTVANGSTTVTASSGVFTANYVDCMFQLTGVNDLTWYQIVAVPTPTTLTLKSAYVGNSANTQSWRIGQTFIFPDEYDDTPVDYALSRYFESKNNKERATYHSNRYEMSVKDAVATYSTSEVSNVIWEEDNFINPWYLPPVPNP